jgi:hypothetical protein
MARAVCTICTNPKRPEIDAALVGRAPIQQIVAAFEISRRSLFRHRDHVVELRGLPREPNKGSDVASTIEQVLELEDELRLLLATARRTKDRKAQLQIIDKLMGMIEFRAKLSGAIKPERRGNKPGAQEGFHGDLDTLIDRARRSKPS